jgi:NADPH:quinone reductase
MAVVEPLGKHGTFELFEPEALSNDLEHVGGITHCREVVEELKSLDAKTLLIVGAGGGVGSFATQFAVNAGAYVIANVRAAMAQRRRAYGAAETFDHTRAPLANSVRQAHPDGVDVLMDLASDADGFSALASLVRRGGTAVTTRHVADVEALKSVGVTGVNFGLEASPALLERVANAVVTGQIEAPPISRIAIDRCRTC